MADPWSLDRQDMMRRQLCVDVERTHPVALLSVRGVLDAGTVGDLHAALLDCLGGQPRGLLVDAAQATLADEVALTVLAAVARESARWPGAAVALAGADGATTMAAHRLGIARSVHIFPGRQAALGQLLALPAQPVHREHLRPERSAPRTARAAVAAFCAKHRVERNCDVAQLIASELVSNAVVHARTPVELTLRLDDPLLYIGVRDHSTEQARITSLVHETAESCRGLLIVDALATSWGNFVYPSGKVVWASVRTDRVAEMWREDKKIRATGFA